MEVPKIENPNSLYFDVNIANDRSIRVVVNEGDDPIKLAKDFASLHGMPSYFYIFIGIDNQMQKQLEATLKRSIEQHFKKPEIVPPQVPVAELDESQSSDTSFLTNSSSRTGNKKPMKRM